MQTSHLILVTSLALVLTTGRGDANPLGIPPDAKLLTVEAGQDVKIDLGTPPPHGWWVKIWGGYKVGDTEFTATGTAQEGVYDPKTGCVFIVSADGGQCFYPSETVSKYHHQFLKSVHGTSSFSIGIQPPPGAHGEFYYRVDFAS